MSLAIRLKNFLTSQSISHSVFADACEIPRPTVSQILHGRNKKVSDEIISKIHKAYPTLSIMWLMFGEGEMFENISNRQYSTMNDTLFDNDNEIDFTDMFSENISKTNISGNNQYSNEKNEVPLSNSDSSSAIQGNIQQKQIATPAGIKSIILVFEGGVTQVIQLDGSASIISPSLINTQK